eukprot:9311214-Pyramimonas_sp.AAC.1
MGSLHRGSRGLRFSGSSALRRSLMASRGQLRLSQAPCLASELFLLAAFPRGNLPPPDQTPTPTLAFWEG